MHLGIVPRLFDQPEDLRRANGFQGDRLLRTQPVVQQEKGEGEEEETHWLNNG
jgi:hypothetical protein